MDIDERNCSRVFDMVLDRQDFLDPYTLGASRNYSIALDGRTLQDDNFASDDDDLGYSETSRDGSLCFDSGHIM